MMSATIAGGTSDVCDASNPGSMSANSCVERRARNETAEMVIMELTKK